MSAYASRSEAATTAAQRPVGVALLGATGSIGTSALRVLERQQERFVPVAMTANGNLAALAEQVARFSPAYVGLVQDCPEAPGGWGRGPSCLVEAATHPDAQVVINAVVGAAGLPATLAALRHGKRVALANKETLVVAGDIVTRMAREHGGELVPVDSEHSAILQCLAGRQPHEVKRLILTASGGPFRTWPAERIAGATRADALKHPTWQMGSKITIDSATLANKALEVIEAHHLFGVPYDRIDVVVHPQSIIHSFVEFVDGSVLAQMGVPSMELPILYALTWPERVPDSGVPPFDPVALGGLTFEHVRHDAFPMLGLGIAAGRAGGAAPAVFNAANEVAVAQFLEGALHFSGIAERVDAALQELGRLPGDSLEALLAADAAARQHVQSRIARES
ncbi:1-deoxy-D-xylulose-5-phosphate reductoisomerase [Gemmatimonas phototrophica]|uniref:1-deoxy-D-xylulose 5-phosphate reductoisomerase n=1 Tax=Gemmatimonas phototrophica TaxID=1379270 RepID=A0A143BKG0_9BACT|nr:1-deoxy-D-xylulose-5-phosphate reductoisomerase [Gemmatimonas phototrophica]AMW05002.1 1-deoxy-D-xylulose 5-phosphate reductoisomerase [Gemmatimonas phototrophica]